MTKIEWTALERKIIEQAYDAEVTQRRIRTVTVSGSALVIALTTLAYLIDSMNIIFWVFVAHVGLTVFEKVGYGHAILGYKSVIKKLWDEVEGSGPLNKNPNI